MRLRHELKFAWAVLVVVQVLTLAGAVGLLARMAPAVGQILADNEFSIESVETMLVELGSEARDEGALLRFRRALGAARDNVTEAEETEQLDRIERAHTAAFAGDLEAREQTTTALLALSRINRSAMARAAAQASELGRTGAWAAAVLGLFSMASAIAVARRIERRVVEPVEVLTHAVGMICEGDEHRRCPTHGPTELAALAQGIEDLRQRPAKLVATPEPSQDRHLLLAMLDTMPGAAFMVDDRSVVIHANLAGTNALVEDPALVSRLLDRDDERPEGWTRTPLDDGVILLHGAMTPEAAPKADPV